MKRVSRKNQYLFFCQRVLEEDFNCLTMMFDSIILFLLGLIVCSGMCFLKPTVNDKIYFLWLFGRPDTPKCRWRDQWFWSNVLLCDLS